MTEESKNNSRVKLWARKALLVVILIIGSMFASSFIVNAFEALFGDGHVSRLETVKMSMLSIAFIMAGVIVICMKLPAPKYLAFFILSIVPVVITLMQIAIYPAVIEGTASEHARLVAGALGYIGGFTVLLPLAVALVWRVISKSQPHE